MGHKPKTNKKPRVGQDAGDPRQGGPESDTGRIHSDAGTGRPVRRAGAPPADLDWPEPSKDAPPEK